MHKFGSLLLMKTIFCLVLTDLRKRLIKVPDVRSFKIPTPGMPFIALPEFSNGMPSLFSSRALRNYKTVVAVLPSIQHVNGLGSRVIENQELLLRQVHLHRGFIH